MDVSLILLVAVGWLLVLLLALAWMRMSDDQDRVARHAEKLLIPDSDVPITQYGTGETAVAPVCLIADPDVAPK
jgi:hypothetical protein